MPSRNTKSSRGGHDESPKPSTVQPTNGRGNPATTRTVKSFSDHLGSLPPEIRRMIWKRTAGAIEWTHEKPSLVKILDTPNTLGNYIGKSFDRDLAVGGFLKRYPSLAMQYIRLSLSRRHAMVASSEFGAEYLEELLATQNIIIEVDHGDTLETYRKEFRQASSSMRLLVDALRRQSLLHCVNRIGIRSPMVCTSDYVDLQLYKQTLDRLYEWAQILALGRVVLELCCTTPTWDEFKINTRFTIGDHEGSRKATAAFYDKLEQWLKDRITADEKFMLAAENEFEDLERRKTYREEMWNEGINESKGQSEVLLKMMEELERKPSLPPPSPPRMDL